MNRMVVRPFEIMSAHENFSVRCSLLIDKVQTDFRVVNVHDTIRENSNIL